MNGCGLPRMPQKRSAVFFNPGKNRDVVSVCVDKTLRVVYQIGYMLCFQAEARILLMGNEAISEEQTGENT